MRFDSRRSRVQFSAGTDECLFWVYDVFEQVSVNIAWHPTGSVSVNLEKPLGVKALLFNLYRHFIHI